MKIQVLAIIFILIILPITVVIGEYSYAQREILRKENLYDSRLITATYDALKAFQINTFNDATSDIVDSKINTIEASVNAFYNSMEVSFGLNGYSKTELQRYVPAIVYTMYDGYYIYSPYANVAEIQDNPITDEKSLNINLNSDNREYGFKPYVYYSCRYVTPNIDVVINYSLDNYITVQGTIDSDYYYKSGYLVTIAPSQGDEGVYKKVLGDGTEEYYYSGVQITKEAKLTDWLIEEGSTETNIVIKKYPYIKLNGTKYYWDEVKEIIFHIRAGERVTQVTSHMATEYNAYVQAIINNEAAINYYKEAYEFTKWVNNELGSLNTNDAETAVYNTGGVQIFENKNIEYPESNFNVHRKEVIRYSIETNLSMAIANFNLYTSAAGGGIDFQMPKLKETEWELLENEISIISFLQGLNLGGKIYNGHTVVTNGKTEEVVKEERIFVYVDEGNDGNPDYYHKINDLHLTSFADNEIKLGILDLDFEIRKDGATGFYYMQKRALGCYTSIVGQQELDTSKDSVYEYLKSLPNSENKLKQIYYTALGRERWGGFKIENPSNIYLMIKE